MQAHPRHRLEFEFGATILLGALLLFQVQPLISKIILPWFGGGPAIWTVCMLFFQALLFIGYSYAFLVTRFLSRKAQLVLHTIVIAAALVQLPIAPDADWKQVAAQAPTQTILLLLLTSIGMPYLVLATTSPLVQVWFSQVRPGSSPYRMYALSNFGSLVALLSYPFLIEPVLTTNEQSWIWSGSFVAFVVLYWVSALRALRHGSQSADESPRAKRTKEPADRPSLRICCLWFALAMTASVMLLAITNVLTLDVAVVPFLWILPLTIYLLSFILCFDSPRWSGRLFWSIAWIVSLAFMIPLIVSPIGGDIPLVGHLAIYLSTLFSGCMVCHGELVRFKPAPKYLTTFYLTLAAGGAGGGIFSALIAPFVFPTFLELPLAIIGTSALMIVVSFRDPNWYLYRGKPLWAWIAILAVFVLMSATLVRDFSNTVFQSFYISRNFYGVLRIIPEASPSGEGGWLLQLVNGRIIHGSQYLVEERLDWPTAYFGHQTGLGIALRHHRQGEAKHVGIVGLGVGTICTYARPGDRYRLYEINPEIIALSKQPFAYVERCQGDVTIVPGDARISLENEQPNEFDVLILDAFSSDAIPVHLLTQQAMEIYLGHLRPDGILVAHVSNRHLDLLPVLAAHADHFGLEMVTVETGEDQSTSQLAATWTVMSREPVNLDINELQRAKQPPPDRQVVWTDDRNSLFELLIRYD